MTQRELAELQGRILARCAGACRTDGQLAMVAGVERSLVSRWRSGEREIGISELVKLTAAYGAEVVLEPLARPDGCQIQRPTAEPTPLRRGSLALVVATTTLATELETALEDGSLNAAEVVKLWGFIESVAQKLARLVVSVKAGRAA